MSFTRQFHHKFSGWNNVTYYVPLLRLPRIPVTVEMFNSVEPFEGDSPIVKECKTKFQLELSEYLGYDILQDSLHLYNGLIFRSVFYSIIMFYVPMDLLLFIFPISVLLWAIRFYIVMDCAKLHKRYLNLTK
jgi:hypothetical protein